ncbi:MAG: tetratricopeptide repeat protein [Myxococcaceae bacterium]
MTAGYSAKEVAAMLDVPASRLRAFVQAKFLQPAKGQRGELRFTFQDLVLLRTAKGLEDAKIPSRRIRSALERLKTQLPEGKHLSAVTIWADQTRILVRDGAAHWNPESGQGLFDFQVAELTARPVATLEPKRPAVDFYQVACELELTDPSSAVEAYKFALERQPGNPDAHINLGRLLHEAGDVAAAEAHYREALVLRPDDATAQFNLGIALEDLGQIADAIEAYRKATELEPEAPDAYFNLSRLYEKEGQRAEALRMLRTYRKLIR